MNSGEVRRLAIRVVHMYLYILDYLLKPKYILYGQRLSHNQRGFPKV